MDTTSGRILSRASARGKASGASGDTARSLAARATWSWAAFVFLVAVAVRLAYLYETRESPLFQTFLTDAQWHAEWAQAIAAGRFSEHRPFFRAPLYPFFLAAAYKLTGDSFVGARIIQHVLGALSCVLVLVLGRRAFDARVGLLAAWICTFYGPLIHYENELLLPALEVFVFLVALLALSAAMPRPSVLRWLATGAAFGLCAIARPNFLLIVPVIAGGWFFQPGWTRSTAWRAARVLALGLGTLLPILPVTLHNIVSGGDWVLISTQGGINFFMGNHALSDGKTAVAYVPPAWVEEPRYVDNVWWSSKVNAEQALGRPLRDSEVSSYWLRCGLDFWRAFPLRALVLTAKKAYFFINGFEIESNRSIYLDALFSPLAGWLTWYAERGPAFPLGPVFPLAVVGLFLGHRARPLARALRLALLVYAGSIVAFFVTGRFRIPIVPLLALFAAHTIWTVIALVRERQYRPLRLIGLSLVGLLLLCNSAFFGVRDVQYARQAGVLGSAYQRLGQPAKALPYFREALEREPTDFAERLNLAETLFRLGRFQEAEAEYRRVLETVPQRAGVHVGLAVALAEQGRVVEALAAVRKALELNPKHGLAHAVCAELLARTGAYAEAWTHVQEAERLGYTQTAELRADLQARSPTSAP